MHATSINFLRFAATCCGLSVITTLGIHLFFPDPPSDPEQRIMLYKDTTYLVNRWWVIFHCLLVIVSMWAFYLVQKEKSPGFAGLGFLFFAAFGIAEITRQMYVLFYINELREQYVTTADVMAKEGLKNMLAYAGQLGAPLFGLFIFAFGLGNLCYGICLSGENGYSRILGLLLIGWSIGNFIALGNSFWKSSFIDRIIGVYSYTYQPFLRTILAVWIWNKSKGLIPAKA
ncbi:MAG: hypothetical protein ABUT20_60565, partial [Bacteroidota bacterium]